MSVEACRLSDGAISVRVYKKEVYILPRKRFASVEDINKMLGRVEDAFEEVIEELIDGEDAGLYDESGDW